MSASFRGHNLMNFETTEKGNRAQSHCVFCKMRVHVIAKPQPNEIEIAGEAVALHCKGVEPLPMPTLCADEQGVLRPI